MLTQFLIIKGDQLDRKYNQVIQGNELVMMNDDDEW